MTTLLIVLSTMIADGLFWGLYLGRPREGDVIAFIMKRGPIGVPSLVLYGAFGHRVYPVLRRLAGRGLLSCMESSPVPERGDRPQFTYSIGPGLKSDEFYGVVATLEDGLRSKSDDGG